MGRTSVNDQKTGLRFFGELTATLSHDIKNVLAIINENAGLLEDLVFMANEQNPVDPERVAMVGGKIQQQVLRADGMVKRLNQVGHSVDEPLAAVNLADMVENMCALAARKAAMKGVTLELLPPVEPITVTTDPFSLQQFFWQCLDGVLGRVGGAKKLEIKTVAVPPAADIVLGPLEDIKDIEKCVEPANAEFIIGALNAELIPHPDERLLTIRLPLG